MLAMLAFSQASTVLAACAMDRSELGQMLDASADHDCCDTGATSGDAVPMSNNACATQATSDLQLAGSAPFIVSGFDGPVLITRAGPPRPTSPPCTQALRAAIPPRILLHSFLI